MPRPRRRTREESSETEREPGAAKDAGSGGDEPKKKGPASPWIQAGIGVILLVLLYFLSIRPLLMVWAMRGWTRTPCVILESGMSTSVSSSRSRGGGGHRNTTTFRFQVRYEYADPRDAEAKLTGDRYDLSWGHHNARNYEAAFMKFYREGLETYCYVNPEDPTESILRPRLPVSFWPGLLIAGLLGLILYNLIRQLLGNPVVVKEPKSEGGKGLKGMPKLTRRQWFDSCYILGAAPFVLMLTAWAAIAHGRTVNYTFFGAWIVFLISLALFLLCLGGFCYHGWRLLMEGDPQGDPQGDSKGEADSGDTSAAAAEKARRASKSNGRRRGKKVVKRNATTSRKGDA